MSSNMDARIDDEFLYLRRAEVAALLPQVGEQIDLVERTYRAVAAGRVELPPKPGIHPRPDAFIHAMPAYLEDDDVAALKWVSGYPQNKTVGRPYVYGLIVLSDPGTGAPLAVMEGAEITAVRTAAASAACVRAWAPQGWRRAAILGCGEQGRFHARALAELNPDLEIAAYDPDPDRVRKLPGNVKLCADPREAVCGSEVIVTAAPIVKHPTPVIETDWLSDRFVALPIDFDATFSRVAIESAEALYVDDVSQFAYYRNAGHFRDWPIPDGSVGDGFDRPRPDRVACVNLGIGALDAAFAAEVYRRARERRIGTSLVV